MAKLIKVHRKMIFRKDYHSEPRHFEEGYHEVSNEDAEHWFVKGNSEVVKDLPDPKEEPTVDKENKKSPHKKNATEEKPGEEERVETPLDVKKEEKKPEPEDNSYYAQAKKKLGY